MEGIQFAQSGGGTDYLEINLITGATNNLGSISPTFYYNGCGYSKVDNYIYCNLVGANNLNGTIYRIEGDRTGTNLGRPNGLPSGNGYNVGTVNANGYLYLYRSNRGDFYVIDTNSNRGTFLKLVDPNNSFSEQTNQFGVSISPISI
ncbi:DUF6923 family protein [Romboutsia sp.]|uniref:DUF6923 family protein n=1 Tax=Romboutsia sp. TaxID=1965302 RepID=UPI003F387880